MLIAGPAGFGQVPVPSAPQGSNDPVSQGSGVIGREGQSSEASPPGDTSTARDVALSEQGWLFGQIVDPQGRPLPNTMVALRQRDRVVANAVASEGGLFSVGGLRSGVYEITTGRTSGIYRLWAPGTAPPGAQRGALIVERGSPVRGQQPVAMWLGQPWVLAIVVAAAIAIPVALHNAAREEAPVSP